MSTNNQEYIFNFDTDGITILKSAVSDEICQLLARYAKLKAGLKPRIYKGSDPLANIHREYGDPMMDTVLADLTPAIEKKIGRELWPTLSFYYYYTKGNILAKHKDRESCEIVAGLCIGADDLYKTKMGSWPLFFNLNGKEIPIKLGYGDLVIFKGHQTEHWREAFDGQWFVSAIFGYVDKNGSLAYQKYDQRKALGKSHVGMFRWYFGKLKAFLKDTWSQVYKK